MAKYIGWVILYFVIAVALIMIDYHFGWNRQPSVCNFWCTGTGS